MRFGAEICDAVGDGLLDHGIVVMLVRKRSALAFEQVLVDSEPLVEDSEGRFKAPGDLIDLRRVQALSVDAAHWEERSPDRRPWSGTLVVDGGVDVDERIQRAGFLVVLEDAFELNHGGISCRLRRVAFGRIVVSSEFG